MPNFKSSEIKELKPIPLLLKINYPQKCIHCLFTTNSFRLSENIFNTAL